MNLYSIGKLESAAEHHPSIDDVWAAFKESDRHFDEYANDFAKALAQNVDDHMMGKPQLRMTSARIDRWRERKTVSIGVDNLMRDWADLVLAEEKHRSTIGDLWTEKAKLTKEVDRLKAEIKCIHFEIGSARKRGCYEGFL